jgi:hypothetical protein
LMIMTDGRNRPSDIYEEQLLTSDHGFYFSQHFLEKVASGTIFCVK